MTGCYPRNSKAPLNLAITFPLPEVVQTSVTFTLPTTVFFKTTLPRMIRLQDRQLLPGSNHILTILKARLTVETDPD